MESEVVYRFLGCRYHAGHIDWVGSLISIPYGTCTSGGNPISILRWNMFQNLGEGLQLCKEDQTNVICLHLNGV